MTARATTLACRLQEDGSQEWEPWEDKARRLVA